MSDLTSVTGLLTFAATAGVISALLTQMFGMGRDWWTARARRHAEAGYLALRLASILEAYAYNCASFINDNANAEQPPDEPYPVFNIRLPKVLSFPEEKEGWHSIDLSLAARGLDLPNHIAGSQGIIDSTAEFSEQNLDEELDEHAGKCGQEAWDLAKALREHYKLPKFEPVWDFTETLQSALLHAQKAKEARARSNAKMWIASSSTEAGKDGQT